MKSCTTCQFFKDPECRRFPPLNGFSAVSAGSWCGEWKAKDAVEVKLNVEPQPKGKSR